MSDSFSNNPFAKLAGKLPSTSLKTKASTASQGKAKGHKAQKKSTAALPADLSDLDEAQLFLTAMQTAAKSSGGKQRREHFAMEEAESFKNLFEQDKCKKDRGVNTKGAPDSTGKPAHPVESAAQQAEDAINVHEDATDCPEEKAFWRAMREVQPLTGKGRDVPLEVEPAIALQQAENALQDFMDGKLEFALALTGEYLEGHVVGLDDLTMNKLRAGQFSPEAHLDLHGLNAVQAFQALLGFFRSAWFKGLRTVLVVPGRGRNSPDGFSILRDKLQWWLTQEPLKRVVLAFCTARPADGGPGSVYVLLRKYRKKGKIHWERMPSDPDLF